MFAPRMIAPDTCLRMLRFEDSAMLAEAYRRNREHLAPREPRRSAEFFTERFQREDIERRLDATRNDAGISLALVHEHGIIGRFTLAGVTRGPFQSAGLGYWIDGRHLGKGLACATVQAIVEEARVGLELHRLEASTLVHNTASQRVLLKCGFRQIGMAPRYLQIAGEWQDHTLFQIILHD